MVIYIKMSEGGRGYVQRPDGVECRESKPSVALLFVVVVGLCVGLDVPAQRVSIGFYFFNVSHASSTSFSKTAHLKTLQWTRFTRFVLVCGWNILEFKKYYNQYQFRLGFHSPKEGR